MPMSQHDARSHLEARRRFLRGLAVGSSVAALGGVATLAPLEAAAAAGKRPDGRPRVPPGQRVLTSLKQMGGDPGDPSRSKFRLKVYGEVSGPSRWTFGSYLRCRR